MSTLIRSMFPGHIHEQDLHWNDFYIVSVVSCYDRKLVVFLYFAVIGRKHQEETFCLLMEYTVLIVFYLLKNYMTFFKNLENQQ